MDEADVRTLWYKCETGDMLVRLVGKYSERGQREERKDTSYTPILILSFTHSMFIEDLLCFWWCIRCKEIQCSTGSTSGI